MPLRSLEVGPQRLKLKEALSGLHGSGPVEVSAEFGLYNTKRLAQLGPQRRPQGSGCLFSIIVRPRLHTRVLHPFTGHT